MYNLGDPTQVEGTTFNLTTYRKSQLHQALTSSAPEADKLQKYINTRVDQSTNETVESLHNTIVNWIIKGWRYDPTMTEVEIIKMIDVRKSFAISSKIDQSKRVINEGAFKQDVDLDHMYELLNQDDDLDRLQKNYKFLLTGIMKLANSVGKNTLEGMKIKTLYTNWLHMINDPNVKFIDPLMKGANYRNQKEPNKIINCYTKTIPGATTVEEKMRTALEAYIHANLTNVDVGKTFESFLLDVYYLFTECLKVNMFKNEDKYSSQDVNEEIDKMSKLFPDSKFTEEFIRKTNSIEEWFNYNPEDLDNEFSIKPYIFTIPPSEIEGLVPLEEKRYVELAVEEESLQLAYHLSKRLTGEEASLYEKIYNSRMDILKHREGTYSLAKEVQSNTTHITPAIIQECNPEVYGLGVQLRDDLINYSGRISNPVDDITRNHINKAISDYVTTLASTYLDYYKRRDWSMKVLLQINPITTIIKEIRDTLVVKDDILYLLGKPLCLNLNVNTSSDRKNGSNYCVITKDYVLVFPYTFIIPQLEEKTGKVELTARYIHDRGSTGASYR